MMNSLKVVGFVLLATTLCSCSALLRLTTDNMAIPDKQLAEERKRTDQTFLQVQRALQAQTRKAQSIVPVVSELQAKHNAMNTVVTNMAQTVNRRSATMLQVQQDINVVANAVRDIRDSLAPATNVVEQVEDVIEAEVTTELTSDPVAETEQE